GPAHPGGGGRPGALQEGTRGAAGPFSGGPFNPPDPRAPRPAVFCDAMLQVRAWLPGPRPMLDDIIQIAPPPLADQEQFYRDWMAFLRTQSSRDADAWLREAVYLSQGTAGLETLARTE